MIELNNYDILQDSNYDEKYSSGCWDLAADWLASMGLDIKHQEALYTLIQQIKEVCGVKI